LRSSEASPKKASVVVDKAQVEFDNLDAIVRVYDEQENYAAGAIAARNALMRTEHRLMVAHERYVAALNTHSRFVNARVEASVTSLVQADNRGKAAAAVDEEEDLVNPKFLKRKLSEPSEGRKDATGKPHRAHASSAALCKRGSWIAWRLLDVLRESAEADPANADARSLAKEVKLLKLIPIEILKEKEKTMNVIKLIEYLLNDINEYSTALYLRHVHGQAVADLFAGDDLYGVDMSLLIHERVEKAKKQVAKDRANATLAAAARGVSRGRGTKTRGRGRLGK
jgi:hypothetical protein